MLDLALPVLAGRVRVLGREDRFSWAGASQVQRLEVALHSINYNLKVNNSKDNVQVPLEAKQDPRPSA